MQSDAGLRRWQPNLRSNVPSSNICNGHFCALSRSLDASAGPTMDRSRNDSGEAQLDALGKGDKVRKDVLTFAS